MRAKAALSLVRVADLAAACRPTHARGVTSERANVAFLERSGDASPVCGATCWRKHVARDPSEVRHRRLCMSLDELVKRDMAARMGRFTHLSSATCLGDHVAPHARPERHRPSTVSLGPTVWSDMPRRPCRSTRSRRATWGVEHVAPPNRMERHERPGTLVIHAPWSDILDRKGAERHDEDYGEWTGKLSRAAPAAPRA